MAGRPILVITPKPYKPQWEEKIAKHLRLNESVHDNLENIIGNLRIHQKGLCKYNPPLMQNLQTVGMVKGGYNVGLRMFSSDNKRNKCVPYRFISDPEKGKPLKIATASKKLEETFFIPDNKGYKESTSNNCNDVAGIVYKNIITMEALKKSFGNLKKKSPGLDDLVKTNWKESSFIKLHKELTNQSYTPKPTKRIFIAKPNGGMRPISVASSKDKVVQGLLKLALESKWEKVFLEESHGFRPKKSCHTALKTIRHVWSGIKWFISLDTIKAFDKIQHKTLIDILKGDPQYSSPANAHIDKGTEDLIWKMLRSGYVDIYNLNDRTTYDEDDVSETSKGVPQGSILSPLLSNIFFHQIDIKLNELSKEFSVGVKRNTNLEYKRLMDKCSGRVNPIGEVEKELASKYPELRQAILQAERNRAVIDDMPSKITDDPLYKRLFWVRHADDILIGIIGSRQDCDTILNKITKTFDSFSLNINKKKSFINHAKTTRTSYLGVDLFMINSNSIRKKYQNNLKVLTHVALTKVQLYIPIKKILLRLVAKGYATLRNDGKSYRGRRQNKYCTASEYDIVSHFSSIIKGLVNYYSFASKKSDLWKVLHIIRKSCTLTLASKFSMTSASQVFKKYGTNLKMFKDGKLKTELFYPTSLKTNHNFKVGYGSSLAGLNEESSLIYLRRTNPMQLKDKCELCGSKVRLELHHIDPIANIDSKLSLAQKTQIARNREYLTLCYICHRSKMHGHKVS